MVWEQFVTILSKEEWEVYNYTVSSDATNCVID